MERKTLVIDHGHCDTTGAYPYQAEVNSNKYTNSRLVLSKDGGVLASEIWLSNEQMRKLKGHQKPNYDFLRSLGKLKRTGSQEDGESFRYFKVAPKDFSKPYGYTQTAKVCGITHGMLMACYLYNLIEEVFIYNDDKLTLADRREIDLLVGCPTTADWTSDSARKAYADLILNATGVHDVKVIPESRAAMFSSIENQRNHVSTQNGAIVFDFGSSTADCTYMLLGRKLIEFSWSLGASSIEHQIAMHAYKEAVKKSFPSEVEMTSIVDNEKTLRLAKEEYYKGAYGKNGHTLFCPFVKSQDQEIIGIPVCLNDQFMQYITKEAELQAMCDSKTLLIGSWQELCKGFFLEAKRTIENATYSVGTKDGKPEEKSCPISTIVLTGGASNMGFIKEICQQVFPQADIQLESNPSYTVSNGLGWIAVLESRLPQCIETAVNQVSNDEKCGIGALKTSVSDMVFDYIKKVGKQEATKWAELPGESSMEDLQRMIDAHLNSPDAQQDIASMCEQGIADWKENLSGVMADAVNQQIQELFSETAARGLIIPSDIWADLQNNGIMVDSLSIDNILSDIDMTSIARRISNVILWIVAVAFAYATCGLSLFIALFANKDKKMQKPRSQSMRKRAVNKIAKGFDDSKDEITKSIKEEFAKFEGEYASMLKDTMTIAFEIATLKRFEM